MAMSNHDQSMRHLPFHQLSIRLNRSPKRKLAPLEVPNLPEELQGLPNPMEWVVDFVKLVDNPSVISVKEYLRCRLRQVAHFPREQEADGFSSDIVMKAGKTLTRATFFLHLQKFEEADKELESISRCPSLKKALAIGKQLDQVIEYLTHYLRCASALLKRHQELQGSVGCDDKKVGDDWKASCGKLKELWEELRPSSGAQASLSFFKAWFGRELRVDSKTMEHFFEAIKLEPGCHVWYNWAYRIKREIRRNVREPGMEQMPLALARIPSVEEGELATKAYQLCPTDMMSIVNYALMLKDKLRFREQKAVFDKEKEGQCRRIVKLLQHALEMAKNCRNGYWVSKVSMHLVDCFTFGVAGSCAKEQSLLRQLELEQNPFASGVFHDLGKMYHFGPRAIQDMDKAEQCYLRVIGECPKNVGCVINYLKLLEEQNNYQEMIDEIDTALAHNLSVKDVLTLENKKKKVLALVFKSQSKGNYNRGQFKAAPLAADLDDNWRASK